MTKKDVCAYRDRQPEKQTYTRFLIISYTSHSSAAKTFIILNFVSWGEMMYQQYLDFLNNFKA